MSGTTYLGKFKDFNGKEYELQLLNSCLEYWIYEEGSDDKSPNFLNWEDRDKLTDDDKWEDSAGLIYNMITELTEKAWKYDELCK